MQPLPPTPPSFPLPASALSKTTIKKKWVSNELPSKVCPLDKALSHDIATAIQWQNIKAYQILEGGEQGNGVLLLETTPNHIVVLKSSPFFGSELFTAKLAESCFGLRVPRYRLIEAAPQGITNKEETENYQMRQLFETKVRAMLSRNFYTPFTMVMEFLAGADSLAELYGNKEALESGILQEPSLLQDIGCMHVMDMILNNFDRIPGTIWNNSGNAGNVMIQWSSKRAVSIDQRITVITAKQRHQYFDKIKNFCNEYKKRDLNGLVVECILKFMTSIVGVTNVEINSAAREHLYAGLDRGVQCIQNLSREKVEQVRAEVAKLMTGAEWSTVCNDEPEIEFLLESVEVFQSQFR